MLRFLSWIRILICRYKDSYEITTVCSCSYEITTVCAPVQFTVPIKRIRSANALNFFNAEWKPFLTRKALFHMSILLNKMAIERKHRHILNIATALYTRFHLNSNLSDRSNPNFYSKGKTLIEILFYNPPPKYFSFKKFGMPLLCHYSWSKGQI